MPKGQAPFPNKKNVDAGKANKSKAVRGGYERTKKSNLGSNRVVTYGKKGVRSTMSRYPGPSK